jgi:hypothetical protein
MLLASQTTTPFFGTMLSWTLIGLILAVVAWVALSGPERPRWLLRTFILALVVILVITELLKMGSS